MSAIFYQSHQNGMIDMNTNMARMDMEEVNLQNYDPNAAYDMPTHQPMTAYINNNTDYNMNTNMNTNMNMNMNMNMQTPGVYKALLNTNTNFAGNNNFPGNNVNYGNTGNAGNSADYDQTGNSGDNANWGNTGNQLGGLNPLSPNVQERVESQSNHSQQSIGSFSQQGNGGNQQTQPYSSNFPQVQQYNSGLYRQLSTADGAVPNFRPAESSHAATETAPNLRVPISPMTPRRKSSQTTQASQQTPVHNGPMSTNVKMPARPKPGRKPIPLPEGEASDRRRQQNRSAQRVFRDKRAAQVADLKGDLEALTKKKKEMEADYEIKLEAKQKEIRSMQQHLEEMTQRYNESESKLQLANIAAQSAKASMPAMANNWNPSSANNLTMPSELETDFTGLYDSGRSPTNNFGTGMDVDGNCGFCTDPGNCACRAEQEAAANPAPTPGNCDACQRDPERAAACRSLAEQTSFNARGPAAQGPQSFDQTSTNANQAGRMDSMAGPKQSAGRTMSCSTLIDRFGETGIRLPSLPSLFGEKLSSYPAKGDSGKGYDVNEQEAAQVLSNMSRRNTMAVDPTAQQQ